MALTSGTRLGPYQIAARLTGGHAEMANIGYRLARVLATLGIRTWTIDVDGVALPSL
jgi:hypothetical protein